MSEQQRGQLERRPLRRCGCLLVLLWAACITCALLTPQLAYGSKQSDSAEALALSELASLDARDCAGGAAALAASKAEGPLAQVHALHKLAAVQWQLNQQHQQQADAPAADSSSARTYRACVLLSLQHSRALRSGAGGSNQAGVVAHAQASSWSFLGALLRSQGRSDDSVAFNEARRLGGSGGVSPWVAQWDVLGPFPHGKTETDGDGLEGLYPPLDEEDGGEGGHPSSPSSSRAARHLSGIEVAELDRCNRSVSYPSDLSDGGSVRWRSLPSQAGGLVSLSHPRVRWNDIAQSISHGALETQAWMVGVVHAYRSGRFSAHCRGVSSFSIDGRSYAGDQYNTEKVVAATDLVRGPHLVRVRVRSKVQTQLACSFTFLSDKVDLSLLSGWVSVPVLNLSPHPLRNLRFRTPEGSGLRVDSLERQTPLVRALEGLDSVAPGSLSYVPLRLRDASKHARCPGAFKLTLTASYGAPDAPTKQLHSNSINIQLRCRKSFGESFIMTYPDADGSISQAGVIPPSSPCVVPAGSLDRSCPVLLALHGMGVTAGGMADAFKFMAPGESSYRFGVDGAWVLAPARFGAHNHEGPGARCIDAAIEALAALSATEAATPDGVSYSDRRADPARIVSTGHSMGGHGSWLWAVHHPDRLLCAAPSAGWLSKELYGDSNRVFEEDQQSSHVDPALASLARAATAEDNVDALAAHLAGVPTLVRVGADDRTTHPYYSRRMARLLREENALAFPSSSRTGAAHVRDLVTMDEVGGKEHWWWDTRIANDGGSMHDGRMRRFWTRCLAHPVPPSSPPRFRVLAHRAGAGSKGGIYIAQLRNSFQLAEIRVHKHSTGGGASAMIKADADAATAAAPSGVWRLRTRNVSRFSLRFVAHILTPALLPSGGFVVDGQEGTPIPKSDLVRILEQDRARQQRRDRRRRAEAEADSFRGDTEARARVVAEVEAAVRAEEDAESTEEQLDLCRDHRGTWMLCTTPASSEASLRRDEFTSGSMRSVYDRPFIFVVGTVSSSDSGSGASGPVSAPPPLQPRSLFRTLAQEHTHMGVFMGNLHAMAAETHVRVVRDVDLLALLSDSTPASAATTAAAAAAAHMRRLNPNLILLGGPESNAYARALAAIPASTLPAPVEFVYGAAGMPARSDSAHWNRTVGYGVRGAPCVYAAQQTVGAPTEGWAAIFLRPLPPMSIVATAAAAATATARTESECPGSALPTEVDSVEAECGSQIPGASSSVASSLPLSPHRSPALALHLDGVDSAGRAALLRLSEPPIPPMVRPPFTNLAPEYLLLRAAELRHRGWGGVSAAGYFDAQWRHQPTRAFDTC